jgi:chromate transport protein ChrA
MKYTLNFIKVIAQVGVVATITFILPAALHALVMFNEMYYFADILSPDYRFGMGFATVIISIMYIVVYTMHMEEVADRKRVGLDTTNKF